MFRRVIGYYRSYCSVPPVPRAVPPTWREVRAARITLIQPDNSLTIVDMAEAENISKSKHLKLVKVVDYDAQTRRPVYKLMTPAEYLKEDMKRKAEKIADKKANPVRVQKLLTVASKIEKHDLDTKIKKISKWLEKHHEVKVVITGDTTAGETIFSHITSTFPPNCKILQKVVRGNDIKFNVMPPPIPKDASTDTEKRVKGKQPSINAKPKVDNEHMVDSERLTTDTKQSTVNSEQSMNSIERPASDVAQPIAHAKCSSVNFHQKREMHTRSDGSRKL